MKINVYMPDELGQRAKAEELNLSKLLQEAAVEELAHRDELASARDGMVQQRLEAEDDDGNPVLLRFVGKVVAVGLTTAVHLTEDGRVVVVFEEGWDIWDSVEEFADWVSSPTRGQQERADEVMLSEAVGALGGRRVIDL